MKKLIVAGCSVSDYTNVDKVYGRMAADQLGYEYVHLAGRCGSNWRIWRKVMNMVMNDEISSDDILIIQYTTLVRDELWSSHRESEEGCWSHDGRMLLREHAYDGDIIRWKVGDPCGFKSKEELLFSELKQNHFTSQEFEFERFKYTHYMFHATLKAKNIPVYYIRFQNHLHGYFEPIKKCLETEDANILDIDLDSDDYVFPDDKHHLSLDGHKYVATQLFNKFTT